MRSFPTHLDISPPYAASVVAVSSTGQVMVVGDTAGTLHHYACSPTATFNEQSFATLFADPAPRQAFADIDDPTFSTACIPFSHTNTPLLSKLNNDDNTGKKFVIRRRPEIDSSILANLRISDFVGYSQNKSKLKANRNPCVASHHCHFLSHTTFQNYSFAHP